MVFLYSLYLISRDEVGLISRYEAISVIEYQGSLSLTGESCGHYICDVKDVNTNRWFRTNDNRDPVPIEDCDVSDCSYVVLFKRSTQ